MTPRVADPQAIQTLRELLDRAPCNADAIRGALVITGGAPVVTTAVVAAGIGSLFDHFGTRPLIYPQFGLGH